MDSHKTVSTNHNLFEEKGRAEAVSNRGPSAYQPNALTTRPNRLTAAYSAVCCCASSRMRPLIVRLRIVFRYPPKWWQWYMVGAAWKCCHLAAGSIYTVQPCTSLQCHFIWSRIGRCRVNVCLAVTCHLHVWQNDRDLLRATAVTRGRNGYRNKSQHRKLTMEKEILPPLLPGIEPEAFRLRACLSTTELSSLPIGKWLIYIRNVVWHHASVPVFSRISMWNKCLKLNVSGSHVTVMSQTHKRFKITLSIKTKTHERFKTTLSIKTKTHIKGSKQCCLLRQKHNLQFFLGNVTLMYVLKQLSFYKTIKYYVILYSPWDYTWKELEPTVQINPMARVKSRQGYSCARDLSRFVTCTDLRNPWKKLKHDGMCCMKRTRHTVRRCVQSDGVAVSGLKSGCSRATASFPNWAEQVPDVGSDWWDGLSIQGAFSFVCLFDCLCVVVVFTGITERNF